MGHIIPGDSISKRQLSHRKSKVVFMHTVITKFTYRNRIILLYDISSALQTLLCHAHIHVQILIVIDTPDIVSNVCHNIQPQSPWACGRTVTALQRNVKHTCIYTHKYKYVECGYNVDVFYV